MHRVPHHIYYQAEVLTLTEALKHLDFFFLFQLPCCRFAAVSGFIVLHDPVSAKLLLHKWIVAENTEEFIVYIQVLPVNFNI